jgi:hypothetical protein
MQTSSRASAARSAEDLGLAEPVANPDASDDTRIEPDRESPPGTPRWVKAFGIIALVLILAFAGLHLTGNAPTHMSGSSANEHGTQAP